MTASTSRAVAMYGAPPINLHARPKAEAPRSVVHSAALAFVWLAVALSSCVFIEPAPFDLVVFGLFILLPVIGLVQSKPLINSGMALWLIVIAGGFLSAAFARDMPVAAKHMFLSLYLVGMSILFAAFVAKSPLNHTKLVLNAYLFASVFAALLGIAGYLNLFPGAADYFTRYDRATGLFKDPNVYGPFLIAGLVTALHNWLTRPAERGIGSLLAAGIILIGILFSFSRGAWMATAFALALYAYLYAITAPTNWERLKLAALVLFGAAALGLVLAAALQSDAVGRFLQERAALTQSYDAGAEGRFGGQLKALDLVLENPIGLGSLMFSAFHHHEEVHNVYLSMLLNSGWVGGLVYAMICFGTVAFGFQHALKKTRTQPLFLIVYAALTANIVEGAIIDSDHWRHFYLLLGLVWGLMASDDKIVRDTRIVADRRPVLLRSVLLIPPSSRDPRIVRKLPAALTNVASFDEARRRQQLSKRAPRIVGIAPATG
jgi:O-antigen ligase